jgi:hypothetical protein
MRCGTTSLRNSRRWSRAAARRGGRAVRAASPRLRETALAGFARAVRTRDCGSRGRRRSGDGMDRRHHA